MQEKIQSDRLEIERLQEKLILIGEEKDPSATSLITQLKKKIEKLTDEKKQLIEEQKNEIITLLTQIRILGQENSKLENDLIAISKTRQPTSENNFQKKESEMNNLKRLLNSSKTRELDLSKQILELQTKIKTLKRRENPASKSSAVIESNCRKSPRKFLKSLNTSQKSIKSLNSKEDSTFNRRFVAPVPSSVKKAVSLNKKQKGLPPRMMPISRNSNQQSKDKPNKHKTNSFFTEKKQNLRISLNSQSQQKHSGVKGTGNSSQSNTPEKLLIEELQIKNLPPGKNKIEEKKIRENPKKTTAKITMEEINLRLAKLKEI